MKYVVPTFALSALLLSATPMCAQAASDAVVTGVVRDAHGTPQMGALVELLGPNASVVARGFTDDHGRYLLSAVLPGTYQVRASAAFLLPLLRANLHVHGGARAVADLSLTAFFEVGGWLPTERRSATEPADDWRWTLRSTANRPLLRFANDPQSGVSSSADHGHGSVAEGQIAFLAGDGSFGQGGNRQEVTLDRAASDGDVSILKANVGDGAPGAGPSMVLAAGLQQRRAWGGGTRFFVSFASHPELQTGSSAGLEVVRTATTETLNLGDAVVIDAGTLFTAERLLKTRFESAPYLRVAFRPSLDTVVEYRLATDRMLQSSEDLDRMAVPEEVLSDASGQPLIRKGLHQEVALTHKDDKDSVTVAVYRDSAGLEALQGGGVVSQQEVAALPIISDPVTDTLRIAVEGVRSDGARVSWTRSLTPSLSANVEGEVGTALRSGGPARTLAGVSGQVHARTAAALAGDVQMKARRSGTVVDLRYRWQPKRTLTQVDEYDAMPNDAYLSVQFRQKLWAGHHLRRVNAVAEATNLLAQGYEPVLGLDGQTLFLAQVPRSVQGGLAFNF